MKYLKCRNIMIVVLAVMLTRVPQLQAAQAAQEQMISTAAWVSQTEREQMADKVVQFIERGDVAKELVKSGVDPQEARSRVASLSDAELQQLSTEIDKAHYGGDGVVGILLVVILVLLIVFLVKRI